MKFVKDLAEILLRDDFKVPPTSYCIRCGKLIKPKVSIKHKVYSGESGKPAFTLKANYHCKTFSCLFKRQRKLESSITFDGHQYDWDR